MEKTYEIRSILVDSDVFLDYFLDRSPFSEQSTQFLDFSFRENVRVNATPLSFANIYYLLRKSSNHKKAINALKDLARMVNIIKINEEATISALDSGWKDFEDALQYFAMIQYKSIEAIVTRNKKDYKQSDLAVFTPHEVLKLLKETGT